MFLDTALYILYFWPYCAYAIRKGAKRMYLQYRDHSRKQVRRNEQKNTFINNTAKCTRDILSVTLTDDKQTSFLFGADIHRLKTKNCFRWCDERPVGTQTVRKRAHRLEINTLLAETSG